MIDFDSEENGRNDWLRIGGVIRGELPTSEYPRRVEITVHDPDAGTWDCYLDGGVRNLFSRKFVEVVEREALDDFTLMPARLNGFDYFFLRCERMTDCLDRQRSRYITFPHDQSRIMQIDHWALHDEPLAGKIKCFCIPEFPILLVTEKLASRIADSDLKGVEVELLP
jgi:hypothetical protein